MASYRFLVQQISGYFEGCEFHHVPRANNEAADALSKLGPTRQAIPPGVSLEHIKKPSITPSPDFESIFISETDLEALKRAKAAERAKIQTLKKQAGARGGSAAPGAADCTPGAADCSKKRKAKSKEQAAAENEKQPLGAADCGPGAAVNSSAVEAETAEDQGAKMATVEESQVEKEAEPQQAMVMVVVSAPSWALPIRDFLV